MLAFAVGAGRAPPQAVLGASASLGAGSTSCCGTLYFLGHARRRRRGGVRAAGAAVARRPAAAAARAAYLLRAARHVPRRERDRPRRRPGTRYALVLERGDVVALVGGAAAALAPRIRRALSTRRCLRARAARRADALRARARPRPAVALASPVDLAHVASAAVWLGGPRRARLRRAAARPRRTRRGARRAPLLDHRARRRSACSALSGLGRALTELHSVSQVWSTSYGRALIVKSALFLPLLGLGWLNRTLLLDASHACAARRCSR